MQNSHHSVWLIDLDGTLYRPPLIKLMMLLELGSTGPWYASRLRKFRHLHEELRAEQAQDPQVQFQPSAFAEQIKRGAEQCQMDEQKFEALISRWMIERPTKWLPFAKRTSLLKEIQNFRDQGGKTALVSDYPAQAKLRSLGALGLFDEVVANGETKGLTRLKPAPDGFLLAAKKLAVSSQDCLVIGDRDDADGAAARAAGMEFRLIS